MYLTNVTKVALACIVFFLATKTGHAMQPPPPPLNLTQLGRLISEADLIAVGKVGEIKEIESVNGKEERKTLKVILNIKELLKGDVSGKMLVIKETYLTLDSLKSGPTPMPRDKGAPEKAIIGLRAGPSCYYGKYRQGQRIIVFLAKIKGTDVYEGDDNPITTIYRDLPLSSTSGTSANEYITSLFSASSPEDKVFGSLTSPYWEQSGSNIYYNNGYVGIGTTNPLQMLHVGGHIFSLVTTGGGVLVGEGLGPNEYGGYVWQAATNTLQFATASANVITFGHHNGTVERMRIDAAGNVGIGTAAPAYTLAVNGTIGCKELTVTSTGWADFVFEDICLSSWLPLDEFFVMNRASGACEAQKGLKGGHGRLPPIETEDKLIQIVL